LADFVPAGFNWTPATRTLSYFAHGVCPVGTYYARFRVTTASGGTDALVAALVFPPPGPGMAQAAAREEGSITPKGPTVTPGALAVKAPDGPRVAHLMIFDLAGRRIATVAGGPSQLLIWEGRDEGGAPVPTGVYLYRMEAGTQRHEGKFVVIR
jgi:hypothetical protein